MMEDSWIYIKNVLLNGNAGEIHEALVAIKDSVIGSNKQKSLLISHEILPILIRICSNNDDITNKIEALIIIGSVAKGTAKNVQLLIQEYQILPLLKRELTQITKNKYSLEICLSALCSIFRHFPSTISYFFDDTCTLPHFLSLTYSGSSLNIQIYVATLLSLLCQTRRDQTDLLNACAIPNLVRLINNENVHLHVPVLRCLCRMAFENRSVSDIICVTSFQGRSLLDTLNYFISRSFSAETQLCAAKCITYIYRSGTLLSSDFRILHRTLPCLVRLCSDTFNCSIRASAAETLSYLIEIDAELQRTAAICNHLLSSLFQLIKINNAEMKQAALKCLAALGANDEIIRKQIVDTNNLINDILENLNSWELQDHAIWEPLLDIINNDPSIEFLIIVTATLCNLLLEFSPAKIPLLNSGIIEKLSNLSDHDESSLKLNCIWALMNLSYQSEENTKTNIINTFGVRRILRILNESNPLVLLKTLGLLRNLLCHTYHIELIMSSHSKDILDGFCIVLENNNSPEIKEQVLCILANIASMNQKDYITSNSNIMDIVCELLFNSDNKLQNAALYVVNNIIQYSDGWFKNIYVDNCYKINIFKRLDELYKSFSSKQPQSDYVCRILKEIVIKCNKMYPEIFN
ncbi:armadillo repeat-containing protein 8-like isoform X2 [Calliphora vicina]|uniref:armadillo repeat-containing protein 8-like isoform X2 n=1 Tax=Calliphora vicina TaxID=7373 RepID=UPI00325AD05A